MRNAESFWILGILVAVPLAARPQLQPFGGRVRSPVVHGCHDRTVLTLRNEGSTRASYRIRWLASDGAPLGRSEPRSLESEALAELDIAALAESTGIVAKASQVEIDWVSERFTRVVAAAAMVPRRACESHELASTRPIPVEIEGPRLIRWAEFQAVSRE